MDKSVQCYWVYVVHNIVASLKVAVRKKQFFFYCRICSINVFLSKFSTKAFLWEFCFLETASTVYKILGFHCSFMLFLIVYSDENVLILVVSGLQYWCTLPILIWWIFNSRRLEFFSTRSDRKLKIKTYCPFFFPTSFHQFDSDVLNVFLR